MKFSIEIDERFKLLNADICRFHGAGISFSISETASEGAAEVSIKGGTLPCFHIGQMDKRTFPVLADRKCADHLVFVFDPRTQEWTLHIFEMKKTVSRTKWEKEILLQLEGGLANACAVMGVLRCLGFKEIHVHCCYRRNGDEASPVYQKAELGKPAPRDWLNEPVVFASFPRITARNAPVKLDENGKGQFDLAAPYTI